MWCTRPALLLLAASIHSSHAICCTHVKARAAPLVLRRGSFPQLCTASQADLVVEGDPAPVDKEAARAAEDKEILTIAGPALLNTLMDPFLGVVDTLFVGRTCSAVALGAVAASSEIFTLCIAASLALRESASSTLVRLFAQDRRAAAETFAMRTLQLAFAVGGVLALVLAGPAAPWCVGLMGAPVGSPLHPDALAYARCRALALPAALALSASEGIFRGDGAGGQAAPGRNGLLAPEGPSSTQLGRRGLGSSAQAAPKHDTLPRPPALEPARHGQHARAAARGADRIRGPAVGRGRPPCLRTATHAPACWVQRLSPPQPNARAPPQQLGGVRWPPRPASGRFHDEGACLALPAILPPSRAGRVGRSKEQGRGMCMCMSCTGRR